MPWWALLALPGSGREPLSLAGSQRDGGALLALPGSCRRKRGSHLDSMG